MSKLQDKIDDALGVDVEKVIEESEQEVSSVDDAQVQKYNERREEIEQIKNDLKAARSMNNANWSEALLKNSAEKIVVAQSIFVQEIEDDPLSRNITALGELSNSLVNTVNAVQDIERNERKIKVAERKNELREKEIALNGGEVIDVKGKGFLGQATGSDLVALLKNGIDPTDIEEDGDAKTEEG
jgi:hypothetical protein